MSTWNAPPSEALWYGCVVVGRTGETDYFYGYSGDETPPDIRLLAPEGWELLEYEIRPTPKNPVYGDPGYVETWSATEGT